MTLLRAAVSALVLILALTLTTHAQAPAVEEVAATLEQAADLAEGGDVDGARALLRTLDAVQLADGGEMRLEPEGWLALLEASPDEAAATLREAAARLRDPTPLPADARDRLETILARREFQPVQPSVWDRLARWLLEWFARILDAPGVSTVGSLAQWVLAIGSGIVVVGVLLFFLRGLRRNVVEGEAAETLAGEIPRHAAEAQQRAANAASSGDFREAMRLLYLAALLHLDEVGLLRFDRALTNREVLASVAADAPLRRQLAPVVSQFDRVWYGHAPFGQQEFEVAAEQLDALRAMGRPS